VDDTTHCMRRDVLCGAPAGRRNRSKPAGTERTKIAEFSISNVAETPCACRDLTDARSAGQVDAIFERVNVRPFEQSLPHAFPTPLCQGNPPLLRVEPMSHRRQVMPPHAVEARKSRQGRTRPLLPLSA
jgi:hypothetical protein